MSHYDLNNKLLDEVEIKKNQEITLKTYEEDYYVIESTYSNQKKQKIKVAAYQINDITVD